MYEPKTRVVVFTKTNAKVLINNTRPIKKGLPFLVNPRMDTDNVWPEYWKIGENNNVVIMDMHERAQRDRDIRLFGIDNDIFEPEVVEVEKFEPEIVVPLPWWAKFEPKRVFESMNEEQRHFYFLSVMLLLVLFAIILTGHK